MNKKNSSKPTFKEEKTLWKQGIKFVIGVDEVGRGAFAGPVTVGAVIFSENFKSEFLKQVNDSKMLSPEKRCVLSPLIKSSAVYSISTISVKDINRVGIGKATKMAFRKAIKDIMFKIYDLEIKNSLKIENWKLKIPEQKIFLLVDGFYIKYVTGIGLKNQKAIIKGDKKSLSIAAASIIAKVHRDNLMIKLAREYPEYGFDIHKGYGTKIHREKIKKHGLSKMHRKSFNLRKFL